MSQSLSRPIVYFVRRVESFQADGIEPPRSLRAEIRCDICREMCWSNRENWMNRDRKYNHRVVCDVCYRLGRNITG